jgi:hypothetical protein
VSYARQTAPEFDGFTLAFEGVTPTFRVEPRRFSTAFDNTAILDIVRDISLVECIDACATLEECTGVFHRDRSGALDCRLLSDTGNGRSFVTSSNSYSYAKNLPAPVPSGYSLAFEGVTLTNTGEARRFSTAFDDRFIIAVEASSSVDACAANCSAIETCVGFFLRSTSSGMECQLLRTTGSPNGVVTGTTSYSFSKDVTLIDIANYETIYQTPPSNFRLRNAFGVPDDLISKTNFAGDLTAVSPQCADLCTNEVSCLAFFVYQLDADGNNSQCRMLSRVDLSPTTTTAVSVSFRKRLI